MFLSILCFLLVKAHAFSRDIPIVPVQQTREHLPFPISDETFGDVFNFTNFNYEGTCGTIFKHPAHTHRDAVIFAMGKLEYRLRSQFFGQASFAMHLLRRSLPNARVLLFWFHEPSRELLDFFSAFDVEMYRVVEMEDWHPTNARFPAIHQWLQQHVTEFDRIVWSDIRDVYHMTDVFRAFGTDDLIFLDQGSEAETWNISGRVDVEWFEQFYGKQTTAYFLDNELSILNAGLIFGGVNKTIEALSIIEQCLFPHHRRYWGYDQSAFNYAYYFGLFDELAPTLVRCSQLLCFTHNSHFRYEHGVLYEAGTGCSPVVRHKFAEKEVDEPHENSAWDGTPQIPRWTVTFETFN